MTDNQLQGRAAIEDRLEGKIINLTLSRAAVEELASTGYLRLNSDEFEPGHLNEVDELARIEINVHDTVEAYEEDELAEDD